MAEFLCTADPKRLSPDVYTDLLITYLIKFERYQLLEVLQLKCGEEEHMSVTVSCHDILHFDASLGFSIIYYPKLLLPLFEEAAVGAQEKLKKIDSKSTNNIRTLRTKRNCHIRVTLLPPLKQLCKDTIGEIRSSDSETLIQIAGTVVRTGSVRLLELSKEV